MQKSWPGGSAGPAHDDEICLFAFGNLENPIAGVAPFDDRADLDGSDASGLAPRLEPLLMLREQRFDSRRRQFRIGGDEPAHDHDLGFQTGRYVRGPPHGVGRA